MTQSALITGITGQDGSYLARHLLDKNYRVYAMRQASAVPDLARIADIVSDITLFHGDMTDAASIHKIIHQAHPKEIYNLAAQSHVHVSFDTPEYTMNVNGLGVLRFLEAIRQINPGIKFFQASTSELFGDTAPPQNELSLMNPRSPYAAAKKYAYDMVRIYREAYGIFACNGIMFNHESPVRGEEFVTRKIAKAIGNITRGQQDVLYLGNLDAVRDWSHASDIMDAAWLMMQQEKADDFILSSGDSFTVREFAHQAFKAAGINLTWEGDGTGEIGCDTATGRVMVAVDPSLFRPLEVENLQGNSSKAREKLNWRPKTKFSDLVKEMVLAEMTSSAPVLPANV